MPRSATAFLYTAGALLSLALTPVSWAAEAKFFPIERSPNTANLPVHAHTAGQMVPTAATRFFPIKRTDRPAPLPIRHTPAKAQIAATDGLPPAVIRAHAAPLAVAPIIVERPMRPLRSAAIRALPAAVEPLPHTFAHEFPGTALHAWPIDAAASSRVTSKFGWRTDPFTGEPAFHGAVDIAAAEGSTVVATAHGVVHAVGEHPRLGRYVMLSYRDGSTATYGHLKDFIVSTGQPVRSGQPIGHVGSTGRSTGPHVDFRLEIDGRRIDPLPLLRRPDLLAAR